MTDNARYFLRPLAGGLVALLLAGCGSTAIFRDNFDADTVGALPNPNPPGAPSGDSIWSTAGSDTSMFAVVNDPVLGSRSARFANAGPSIRYVGFIPTTLNPSADRIYAYWTGTVNVGSAPLDVWLGDTHFAAIGGFRFHNGNFRVRSGTSYNTIGSYQNNASHVIVLSVDKNAGTYNVSFLQGSNSASQNNIPVLNPAAMNTVKPTLYMSYFDGGTGGTYVVDEVVISEKAPE